MPQNGPSLCRHFTPLTQRREDLLFALKKRLSKLGRSRPQKSSDRALHVELLQLTHLMVDNGEDQWTSMRYYRDGNEPLVIASYLHEVLRRFADDIAVARQRFVQFVRDGLNDPKALEAYPAQRHFIGGDQFIHECKNNARLPTRRELRTPRPAWEDLLQAIWETFEISESTLLSSRRDRRLSEARRALVYLAREKWRISTTELALRLHKTQPAISQMYWAQSRFPNASAVSALAESLLAKHKQRITSDNLCQAP